MWGSLVKDPVALATLILAMVTLILAIGTVAAIAVPLIAEHSKRKISQKNTRRRVMAILRAIEISVTSSSFESGLFLLIENLFSENIAESIEEEDLDLLYEIIARINDRVPAIKESLEKMKDLRGRQRLLATTNVANPGSVAISLQGEINNTSIGIRAYSDSIVSQIQALRKRLENENASTHCFYGFHKNIKELIKRLFLRIYRRRSVRKIIP
jgi:type II secretory pathway pseudopilin PulG